MADNWAADVKKYAPDADDSVIAGIVRYCGISLRNRDSSLVSFADPAETARVRSNFLKKKLALTRSDEELDAGIAAVGALMKGENFRNRVTVYYLLARHFDQLQVFAKPNSKVRSTSFASLSHLAPTPTPPRAPVARPAPAPEQAPEPAPEPTEPEPAAPVEAESAPQAPTSPQPEPEAAPEPASLSATPVWIWLVMALAALAILWWLFRS